MECIRADKPQIYMEEDMNYYMEEPRITKKLVNPLQQTDSINCPNSTLRKHPNKWRYGI
jgi:hypothetical protein